MFFADKNKQVVRPAILIVDNHNSVRISLREWLSAVFSDYKILEAGNGEEAVEIAFTQKPKIILMDVWLPGINGIEAVRRIKERSEHVQAVVLSLYESPEFRADAKAAGAVDYVLKDKLGVELIPVLTRLMSETGSVRNEK